MGINVAEEVTKRTVLITKSLGIFKGEMISKPRIVRSTLHLLTENCYGPLGQAQWHKPDI